MKQPLGFILIATRGCGRMAGLCWDDEGAEKHTARWALSMLRSGLFIQRVDRFHGDPMPESICIECRGKPCQQGRAIGVDGGALEALKRLHACMLAQDLENEAERPSEEEYQACMAAACAAIAKATGQEGGAA